MCSALLVGLVYAATLFLGLLLLPIAPEEAAVVIFLTCGAALSVWVLGE